MTCGFLIVFKMRGIKMWGLRGWRGHRGHWDQIITFFDKPNNFCSKHFPERALQKAKFEATEAVEVKMEAVEVAEAG